MKRLVMSLIAALVFAAFAVPATESVAHARPGVCAAKKGVRKSKAKKNQRHAKPRGKKAQGKGDGTGSAEDVGSGRPKGSKGLQL